LILMPWNRCRRSHSLIRFTWLDNATGTSLFCLPVRVNEANAFKLALRLISRGRAGIDATIVHTLQDKIIVEAGDGIEEQVRAIVKEAME